MTRRDRWAQQLMRNPLLAPVYEHVYRPTLAWTLMGFDLAHVRQERAQTVAALRLAPGDAVLDVACGPGLFTKAFAEAVSPSGIAVGIDMSAPMLARARTANAHPRAAYVFADATDQPFPDDAFDAVNCYAALYLIPDPWAAFEEMCRVLRPGGRIALMSSRATQRTWIAPAQRWATGMSGLKMFGEDEFTSALAEAGFTEISQEFHGVAQYVAATAP
ncbi:methyltransferase domain-containing protein [Nocardioides sp. AE5]|uniref:methyltransferase domain-containing protein n=1 Tax=Nocardioides sp. AE5 TaxID=2962573 RepID=UPI0028817C6C|nr:methyltransferase domain-containing protein [Nocardioides sp. AE5]MDT0202028.1 methyltransferase domain-containing protein [Nocardioides sp. AE5]